MCEVAVIGTIFMDCKGFAQKQYHPFGRNIGSIQFVHGGVGRNVAENLANLGITTAFVSTVDNSAMGTEIMERLQQCNIKLDHLFVTQQQGMGMWLAILDTNGDLAGSISQMPDLMVLEKKLLTQGQVIVSSVSHVVLELDLNEHITRHMVDLAQAAGKPIYGIPGNLNVVLNNKDILGKIDCFICNDIEAGRLFGTDFSKLSLEDMQIILKDKASRLGMKSLVVTLGSKGSIYYDANTGQTGYQPVVRVKLVDSCGAGDAFFSGTVMALVKGYPLAEAVVYGTQVAAWTIQCQESTCPDLADKIKTKAFNI